MCSHCIDRCNTKRMDRQATNRHDSCSRAVNSSHVTQYLQGYFSLERSGDGPFQISTQVRQVYPVFFIYELCGRIAGLIIQLSAVFESVHMWNSCKSRDNDFKAMTTRHAPSTTAIISFFGMNHSAAERGTT